MNLLQMKHSVRISSSFLGRAIFPFHLDSLLFSPSLLPSRETEREREVANEVNLLGRRKIGGRKVAQGATRMRGHLHKYGPRNLHDPARFVIFRS